MSSLGALKPAARPQAAPAHLPLLRIQYDDIVRRAL